MQTLPRPFHTRPITSSRLPPQPLTCDRQQRTAGRGYERRHSQILRGALCEVRGTRYEGYTCEIRSAARSLGTTVGFKDMCCVML